MANAINVENKFIFPKHLGFIFMVVKLGGRCWCEVRINPSGCHPVGHFANPHPHDDAPHDSLFSERPAACQVRMVLTGNILGRAIVILECRVTQSHNFLFDKFFFFFELYSLKN